jgi:hypothetical protein
MRPCESRSGDPRLAFMATGGCHAFACALHRSSRNDNGTVWRKRCRPLLPCSVVPVWGGSTAARPAPASHHCAGTNGGSAVQLWIWRIGGASPGRASAERGSTPGRSAGGCRALRHMPAELALRLSRLRLAADLWTASRALFRRVWVPGSAGILGSWSIAGARALLRTVRTTSRAGALPGRPGHLPSVTRRLLS